MLFTNIFEMQKRAISEGRFNEYFTVKEYYSYYDHKDKVIKQHTPNNHHLFSSSCLIYCVTPLRKALKVPFIITSGKRTWEQHVEIYRRIAQRKNVEFRIDKVPTQSRHLFDIAMDVQDKGDTKKEDILHLYKPNGDIKMDHPRLNGLTTNEKKLLENLYFEHPTATKGWLHIQIAPTNQRFFMP